MTRKLLALLATTTLMVLVGAGTAPSDAAHKKNFRYAVACAFSNAGDGETSTTFLSIDPQAGRWHAGQQYEMCFSELGGFAPTVRTFTAKVHWYVGGVLVKTSKKIIHNNGTFEGFNLRTSGLHTSDGSTYTKDGKRVTAKLTMSKTGYRSKTLVVRSFEAYS